MVFNLADKVKSNKQFHTKNLDKVKWFLIDNSYPAKFITENIKKRIKKINN